MLSQNKFQWILKLFSDVNECSTAPSDDICSYDGAANFVVRWYYDTKEKECEHFLYDTECGSGKDNIFLTKSECEAKCL